MFWADKANHPDMATVVEITKDLHARGMTKQRSLLELENKHSWEHSMTCWKMFYSRRRNKVINKACIYKLLRTLLNLNQALHWYESIIRLCMFLSWRYSVPRVRIPKGGPRDWFPKGLHIDQAWACCSAEPPRPRHALRESVMIGLIKRLDVQSSWGAWYLRASRHTCTYI